MQPNSSRVWNDLAHLRRVFGLLVLYRWVSLLPPLIFLASSVSPPREIGALLAAAFSNLLITLTPTQLNQVVRRFRPDSDASRPSPSSINCLRHSAKRAAGAPSTMS